MIREAVLVDRNLLVYLGSTNPGSLPRSRVFLFAYNFAGPPLEAVGYARDAHG